ncbi:unnamed protein product [Arabidopsis thaliana]|uniref:(thale cress) hypothetical protein n=1 Tax=Arabidopsis thaliana TaxID=3702 RepID=A0A7G2E9L5_ARATH|nr:unnamed protein product [Arabidopsis thaliana]
MDNHLELAIKDAITADDLKRVDQESQHPLLAQELDLDSLENPPRATTHTYRLYSKGLVSEELIKDDTMLVVGLGLSLCDSHDNTKQEINKALRNQKLAAHPEAAELAAIIHGLKWALELGIEPAPNESIVAKLLEHVSLLQTRFTSCQALATVSRDDIVSVIKLAKDAIASQTRWCEGDTEYESCPVCYAYVSPNDKFEVQGCFHRICVTCMRKPFSSEQILRGNTAICPYPDCENDLVPEDYTRMEKVFPVSEHRSTWWRLPTNDLQTLQTRVLLHMWRSV